MNNVATFEPATPAMVVGQSFDGSPPPLGLGEAFALLGGDRLGPDGIPFRIMHEHQPGFRRWVAQSCRAALASERPWFRGVPLLLTGTAGAGRTHAARWLARVVGVPHVVLNLSDPLIAASIAASRRIDEDLWGLPLTIGMAAARCANPVVTVIGADKANSDVQAGFTAMVDPDTGRSWSEDRLGTSMDLGEVTWIVQCDNPAALPSALRNSLTPVALEREQTSIDHVLALSVLLEVMGDLGIEPGDPAYSWSRIREKLPSRYAGSAKSLYADMSNAISDLHRDAELAQADDLPF